MLPRLLLLFLALASCAAPTRPEPVAAARAPDEASSRQSVILVEEALPRVEDGATVDVERPCFPSGECWRMHGPRNLIAIDSAGGLTIQVGERGAVVEIVDGTAPRTVPAFTDADLTDVWVRNHDEAWVVGDRVYRRTATGWNAVECGEQWYYVAVHGDRISGRVVAIGQHWLARIDDADCEVIAVPVTLGDVWVEPGGRRAWAVGGVDRVSWTSGTPTIERGPPARFIAGRAADDVWISGAGTTAHFDGLAWAEVHDPPDLSVERIEPAFVNGEDLVISALGRTRDARGWRPTRPIDEPQWRAARDVAIAGDRWISTGVLATLPAPAVESRWVDDGRAATDTLAALAITSHAIWASQDVLHRIDESGVTGWDPFPHYFWRRDAPQCLLARTTGLVSDGQGGMFVAAQGTYECPDVASLLHVDAGMVDRDERPLPFPIRQLVRLRDGSVLGLSIGTERSVLVVSPRGRIRRVRLPASERESEMPPPRATACATPDGTVWLVDDEFRFFRIPPGGRAIRIQVVAGTDAVTCDDEAAWVVGCNGRIGRCSGARCVEVPTDGEPIERSCGDPRYDDSPLAGSGPFHPFVRTPSGGWVTAVGGNLYSRTAADAPWRGLGLPYIHDLAALGVRDDRFLVALARNGDLVEVPLDSPRLSPPDRSP